MPVFKVRVSRLSDGVKIEERRVFAREHALAVAITVGNLIINEVIQSARDVAVTWELVVGANKSDWSSVRSANHGVQR